MLDARSGRGPRLPELRVRAGHRREPDGHGPPAVPDAGRDAVSRARAHALRRHGARPGGGRAVRAGVHPGRPLPHRRPDRPRRHGRGVPRGRPEARAAGRPEVPAARPRRRRGAPRPLLPRGARGAPGLAHGRVPRVRRGGGRRPPVPLDGARGRREPRLPAAADRPAPDGQGARHRAPALRRPRRGARERRPAPRPQAGERDARRPGERPHHRLRAGGPRAGAARGGRALGDAVVHVAGAAAGARGHGPQRRLRSRPAALRAVHRSPRLPGPGPGRADAQAPRRAADRAVGARGRPRSGRRARDPRLPREGAPAAARLGAGGRGHARGARPARRRHRRGRDAVAGAGGGRGRARGPATGRRLEPAGAGAGRSSPRAGGRPALPPARAAAGREAAGRARGPRPRAGGAPGEGRRAGRRRLGPEHRLRLPVPPARDRQVPRPLGGPARRTAGAAVLVSPEPASDRAPGPDRASVRRQAGPGHQRHGRGDATGCRGGCCASTRCPRSSRTIRRPRRARRTGPRSSPRRASTLRRSAPSRRAGRRRSTTTRGRPGKASGRRVRRPGPHRGGLVPRAAGLVRGDLAVVAARAPGEVVRRGQAQAGGVRDARLHAAGGRRADGPPQHGARTRRPARRVPRGPGPDASRPGLVRARRAPRGRPAAASSGS